MTFTLPTLLDSSSSTAPACPPAPSPRTRTCVCTTNVTLCKRGRRASPSITRSAGTADSSASHASPLPLQGGGKEVGGGRAGGRAGEAWERYKGN